MTLGDNDVFSELARLRGLIKWAEWGGWVAGADGMEQACLWCLAKKTEGKHRAQCTAFQEKGEVK